VWVSQDIGCNVRFDLTIMGITDGICQFFQGEVAALGPQAERLAAQIDRISAIGDGGLEFVPVTSWSQ
jgi:hypothetical protein